MEESGSRSAQSPTYLQEQSEWPFSVVLQAFAVPTWDLDPGGMQGCESQSGGFLLLCLSGKGIER